VLQTVAILTKVVLPISFLVIMDESTFMGLKLITESCLCGGMYSLRIRVMLDVMLHHMASGSLHFKGR